MNSAVYLKLTYFPDYRESSDLMCKISKRMKALFNKQDYSGGGVHISIVFRYFHVVMEKFKLIFKPLIPVINEKIEVENIDENDRI